MKFLEKNNISKQTLFYIAFAVSLVAFFYYIGTIFGWVGSLVDVFRPVIYGISFAFLLNVLMVPIEKNIFRPFAKKSKVMAALERPLSIIVTFLVLLGILALVFLLVLPRFIESLASLAATIPTYVDDFIAFANKALDFYNLNALNWANWAEYTANIFQKLANALQNAVPHVLGFTVSITSGVINVVFGFIFAFYMLAQKEVLIQKTKAVFHAYVPKSLTEKVFFVGDITNTTFRNFLGGQCLDSLCLGTLTFIVLNIFDLFTPIEMPYALVIAVTIAVTNMIPIIGPILGTIPCAFIVLVISPVSALILVVTIILLQEFESKVIYPRIVGGRVGLDGLWVLMAVLIGGNLGGLLGIILGVPTCAVLGKVIGDNMEQRLGGLPWKRKSERKSKQENKSEKTPE